MSDPLEEKTIPKQTKVLQHEDVEHQSYVHSYGASHPCYWGRSNVKSYIQSIEENSFWSWSISIVVLLCIMHVIEDLFPDIITYIFDAFYLLYVITITINVFAFSDTLEISKVFKIAVDTSSFVVYALDTEPFVKTLCYCLRLHRPLAYLSALNDYNLKLTVVGTACKYLYIFMILRITFAVIWIINQTIWNGTVVDSFWFTLFIVDKMFTPIGPPVEIKTDAERILCMIFMTSGCLVVTGAAIASLSLVISIYLRPEETFRARYRLIIKEMRESRIPSDLSEKVKTFYKMYWNKQRAVSTTQLLPIFPPTLPATVFTEIYFEATQKSRVLRELPYQFLRELSKHMTTIHYIPGDHIIKRNSKKSSVIYVTYGDVDMLTAEDDVTPILRMTRGTVLTPCGVCPSAGGGRAHVEVRAATFCMAHVTRATDLWRTALKYGKNYREAITILTAFYAHIDRVKRHYFMKPPEIVKYKSSIKHFKKNLMALKKKRDDDGELLLPRSDVFIEVAGCYVMRNRSEASDDSDAICLRSTFPCILQPRSSLLTLWGAFVASIILTVCITHPYYLVYKGNIPIEFRIYDYVVTIIFFVDIIAFLSTGDNVEDGVPITFTQTAWQQMKKFRFILDLLGTLPLFEFIFGGHFAGINKLLRLPRLFGVLKSVEEACVYQSNLVRFLSYTLMMMIACYLMAAWQQGFMCFTYNYCVVTNFTHSPFWEDKPLDENTTADRLYFSMFWAISVITFTTHYDTFSQKDEQVLILMMVVIEICIVLHVFIEAVYSATIMVTTVLREDYDACIGNVRTFLMKNKVDPLVRRRFITYLQLCWYTDQAYSMSNRKSSVFFDLPPHVYQDILARQRSKHILSIPFMMLVNQEDLKKISSAARLFHTSPNEIILNTGDISNEIYVIKRGICEVYDPITKKVVSSLTVRNHFGILECMLRIPAYYTVRAVSHVQILSISRKHLVKTMEIPQVKEAIEFAKEQPEYGRLMEFRDPFLMVQPPEPTPNRMKFRLPRKHERDLDFLHPFRRLGFLSVMRYLFPRFTIRPDGNYLMRYEWFRTICAVASSMVFPIYSYLVLQFPWLQLITTFLDISAYFDIVQRMLIGYFDSKGVLIFHPLSTSAHYLRGTFFVDLIACMPLENLDTLRKESFDKSNSSANLNMYRVTETRQFLMLNRQLQLYRLSGTIQYISAYLRRDIQLIFHAVPLFMALLNILTCFIVFYSVHIYYIMDTNIWFIVPIEKNDTSWITIFKKAFRFNITESPWSIFLASYFWVTYQITTTGYNNIRPSSRCTMVILFFGLFISAMLVTYYSVRIISVRANVNKSLAAYQEHLKDMVAFMKKENLSNRLQREVVQYYAKNWNMKGALDSRNVLKLCGQITLRTDAILNLYGTTFAKCPILADLDVSLIRTVGRGVRSVYYLRGMRVFENNDVISDIFIVDQGTVNMRRVMKTVCQSYKLKCGSVFGNIECEEYSRSKTIMIAHTDVQLLQINAVTFLNIISEFPDVYQRFRTFREEKKPFIEGGSCELDVKTKQVVSFTFSMMTKVRKTMVGFLLRHKHAHQAYLMLVSMTCVFGDLYNAGFQDNDLVLLFILWTFDVLFYFKIIAWILVPEVTGNQALKTNLFHKRGFCIYPGFYYDIISCVPIEFLIVFIDHNEWLWFSFLRLNRLFRIVSIDSFLNDTLIGSSPSNSKQRSPAAYVWQNADNLVKKQRTMNKCLRYYYEKIRLNLAFITIVSVLIWFSLFVHAMTCIWYFIGLVEDTIEPKTSWFYKDTAVTSSGNSTSHSDEMWCDNYYICSLYFILTTFTQNGVGDIMPKKQSEVIFVSILQIISVMMCMIYVGELSSIIQYQSFRTFSYHCKCLELREFMKNNRVSKTLVDLVNKYSLHLWRESRGEQMPYFLKTAPTCMKLRVMSETYMQHFDKIPIFKKCEPAFLRQLVGFLHPYTYNEGMYVVKENEITDSMYLIHRGRVRSLDDQHKVSIIYNSGDSFGLLQGLIHNLRFTETYQTIVKSQVLTLNLNRWEYLLNLFPKSRDEIYKHIGRDPPDSPKPHPFSHTPSTKFKPKPGDPKDPSKQSPGQQDPSTSMSVGPVKSQVSPEDRKDDLQTSGHAELNILSDSDLDKHHLLPKDPRNVLSVTRNESSNRSVNVTVPVPESVEPVPLKSIYEVLSTEVSRLLQSVVFKIEQIMTNTDTDIIELNERLSDTEKTVENTNEPDQNVSRISSRFALEWIKETDSPDGRDSVKYLQSNKESEIIELHSVQLQADSNEYIDTENENKDIKDSVREEELPSSSGVRFSLHVSKDTIRETSSNKETIILGGPNPSDELVIVENKPQVEQNSDEQTQKPGTSKDRNSRKNK